MARRIVLAVVALAILAGVVLLVVYNRGQAIVLELGVTRWSGEAVYAILAALFLGLVLMFLVGLPADLALRRQNRRLARRVRELEPPREPPPPAEKEAEEPDLLPPAAPPG